MQRDDQKGKRRPPRDTRFKPGQSGNPTGRPKGSVSFQTLIEQELRKSIVITENGRQKRLTKQQIIVRRLAHDGIKGDYKAIALLMKLANISSIDEAESPETGFVVPDTKTLRIISRRLKNMIGENK